MTVRKVRNHKGQPTFKKVGGPGRRLWYHAESESYTESYDENEDTRFVENDCVEVSGMRLHEANFLEGEESRFKRAVAEVERYAEARVRRARYLKQV